MSVQGRRLRGGGGRGLHPAPTGRPTLGPAVLETPLGLREGASLAPASLPTPGGSVFASLFLN